MNREENIFQYTYSTNEQEEIQKIRNKYIPQTEDKMNQLRHLDMKVTQKATMYSLAIGLIGTLLLGIGMCCSMVWADNYFILGIVIGVPGIIITALAYPTFNHVLRKEREKVAPEIISLCDELLK